MKSTSALAAVLAAAALLSACSKQETDAPKGADAEAQQPATNPDTPRPAVYDPNLKPANIVWDSPEKKAAWEAKQAELAKRGAAPAAPASR